MDQLADDVSWSALLSTKLLHAILGVAIVGMTTAAISLLERLIPIDQVSIIYLMPIVIAATRWGIWPAAVMAIASAGAADFFFIPPLYSFRIDDPQEAIDLLLFLFVALVSSNLASRLWRETATLRRREAELHNLYDLSHSLAACFTVADMVQAIQHYLSQKLKYQAAFLPVSIGGRLELTDIATLPHVVRQRVSSIRAATGLDACTIYDDGLDEHWLVRIVGAGKSTYGIIAVSIGRGSPASIARRTLRVDAVLEEAAGTLRRIDIGKALQEKWHRDQTQLLRDALHGTLSHELRSPLAAIQGSASVLMSLPALSRDPRIHTLVDGILDEVHRLDGFIGNLVNATRVTAGGVEARRDWVDPKDIVNAALLQRSRRLATHNLEIDLTADLPLIHVDCVLIEEAFGQLIENAAKYSPSGSTIVIAGISDGSHIILSATDEGVGIERHEALQLGQKFFRSARHLRKIPGSGLGFWIATTFVRANGGDVHISSQGAGCGTTASIRLPACWVEPADLVVLTDE